jgi:hypothetical protein
VINTCRSVPPFEASKASIRRPFSYDDNAAEGLASSSVTIRPQLVVPEPVKHHRLAGNRWTAAISTALRELNPHSQGSPGDITLATQHGRRHP